MAVTDWTPSKRLANAARAELRRVDRAIAKVEARQRAASAQLAALNAEREDLDREREGLVHFAGGRASEPRPKASPDGVTALQGAAIRETAVRVLADDADNAAGIHYRDWYALLTAAGFEVIGADPLASFLTQVSRSPVVRRSTEPGVYSLDFAFVRHAHERHAALSARLAAQEHVGAEASVTEIVEARGVREALTKEMRDVSRQLEEAMRSLPAMVGATDSPFRMPIMSPRP